MKSVIPLPNHGHCGPLWQQEIKVGTVQVARMPTLKNLTVRRLRGQIKHGAHVLQQPSVAFE